MKKQAPANQGIESIQQSTNALWLTADGDADYKG